jgi:FkbM family methyltransferase
VHVEPTPAYAQALRDARPDETVVQAAIGHENELIPFFQIAGTGISTGDAAIAHRHEAAGYANKRIDVPCIRLSSLLDNYQGRDIHWMKIDVEGMELSVLRSWASSAARPWIVVLESTLPLLQEQSHTEWEGLVLALGYHYAYFDGLNRFYVSERHLELLSAFSAPPNVFDRIQINGTASNFLHTLITQRHGQEVAALQERLRNYSATAESTIEALRVQQSQAAAESFERTQADQRALAEIERIAAGRENQLQQELIHARQLLLVQSQERAARERAVSDQLQTLQLDASRNLASLESEHRTRADAWHREHAAERAASEAAQIERERRIVDQARSCENLLREQLAEARHYASHLADELNNLERSWVWRMTRPFGRPRPRTGTTPSLGTLAAPADCPTSTSNPAEPVMINDSLTVRALASADGLLGLHDAAFVKSAYLTILGRPADPTGLAELTEQLRAGADKEQLLAALATSAEGKASTAAASLPGLEQLVARARRKRPSLLRRALQRLAMSLLRPLSNQVRATDARLIELWQSTQARFDHLDAAVAALGQMSTLGGSLPSAADREALDQTSLHGREIYFKLKDAAAQQARVARS